MSIKICHTCHQHYLSTSLQCPNCIKERSSTKAIPLAILMGLGLMACGDQKSDTAQEDTAQEASSEPEPSAEDLYGVPEE